MAINFNNQNTGIGTLDLSEYGLVQPEENMTVAEAINYGVLPQAQETFKPNFGGMLDPTSVLEKGYTGTTRGDFINAIESGAFGAGTNQMFDRNVGDVFEGVDLGKKGTFSFGDVSPTLIGTDDGTFRQTIDIDKGALSPDAIKSLPGGFFKSIGDQSSLGLPADDKFAMAISNYDQLFGPKTMTDANQSLYTGMMDQSGIPINYTDRIRQQNLPGFAYQPKESLRNIIGSKLQNAKTNVGQKVDQGMDFMGGIKDYIMGGGMLGMAAKGIGGLLSNIFQESPEQKNFRENIATDPEYQNLVSQIPGMSNYNQIFAMGSGRGLMGAIDKRLATLARTEKRQGVNFSDTLKERRKKLEALRELERQKESAFLESQRRGRRPGTGGGDGGGTPDKGGSTGGFSYDSGGRKGYGYGLKDGGLASMFTRRG